MLEIGFQALDVLQNPFADDRMLLDQLGFLRRQTAGLLQDQIRNSDLAQVMQQGAHADDFQVVLGKVHGFGDGAGIFAHAPAVACGVSIPGIQSLR